MLPLFALSAALAGPWIREPGGVYAKAALGRFLGAEAPAAGAAAGLAYRDWSASLTGELGLPAQLQLSASLPYVVAANDDGRAAYTAWSGGDAELGLSRLLVRRRIALSAGLAAKIPLYVDRSAQRAEGFGAYAASFPVPGDGQVDLDGRLELGASLSAGRAGLWTEALLGLRHRFGPFTDGLPWSVKLGAAPRGAAGRPLGWIGLEAGGVQNLAPDPLTRTWTRFGAFAAVKLDYGLAIEGFGGLIPFATASRTGGGGGLGLSWTR